MTTTDNEDFDRACERAGATSRASIDPLNQVVYALQRAKQRLEFEAAELHEAHDYSAEFPASDAEQIGHAISFVRVLGELLMPQAQQPGAQVVAKVPVPSDVLEARTQGRAEALAIVLGLEAETGLDEYVDGVPPGPSGDWGFAWNEAKLRELFRADDSAWSLLQEAEDEYWHNLGLRQEAERIHANARPPAPPPLPEGVSEEDVEATAAASGLPVRFPNDRKRVVDALESYRARLAARGEKGVQGG